jgi:hypothetical protein
MTDTTKEILKVLHRYMDIIEAIDRGDFSKLERYQITDYIVLELAKAYQGLKRLEKTFGILEGLSRNMGRIK